MEEILKRFILDCNNNLVQSKNNPEIDKAFEYLELRGISNESIIEHNLGYCFKNQKIPKDISFFGRDGKYDKYWSGYNSQIEGRVVVPILSEFNNHVGFATHTPFILKDQVWWNLPKPFYKGNHLFLLNKSRKEIFDKNKVYLVEGYVDAILMYQKGIKNVAALMGTALTQRKISLIMRYCDNICFCLDSDENESGQNARDKSIAIIDELGFCDNISTIDLPLGEDPASYLLKNEPESLLEKEHTLTYKEIIKIKKKLKVKK